MPHTDECEACSINLKDIVKGKSNYKPFIVQTLLGGILLILGLYFTWTNFNNILSLLLFISVILLCGRKIIIDGLRKLFYKRRIYIEFLVFIAALGALIIGEYAEGGVVIFLFSIANFLEEYASDNARRSIEMLMEKQPIKANVIRNGLEVEVEVENVRKGEIIIIRPGDEIPLDGTVIEGSSAVDESLLTGESIPVDKKVGDRVFAGTYNVNSFLKIRVDHRSEQTLLRKIIDLLEKAKKEKSNIEMLVERFSQIYTPTIIVLSMLTMIIPPLILGGTYTTWIYRGLILLVVSCPCAFALSTPITMYSGLTCAARNGILIKGGKYLEHLGYIDTVAFDKTGTITKGKLKVSKIIPLNSKNPKEILSIAASLDKFSNHPVAKAIVSGAENIGAKLMEVSNYKYFSGKGGRGKIDGEKYYVGNVKLFKEKGIQIPKELHELHSQGMSIILVGNEEKIIGIIGLEDEIRSESRKVISALKSLGLKIVMLTGDNNRTAETVSKKLNIDEYYASLLPNDKVKIIEKLMNHHNNHVAMIGDGINDAPALAKACVGIAIGSGTEVAIEGGDIVLIKPDLRKLPFLFKLGREALKVVKENTLASISIKLFLASLAIIGLINLWIAVLIGDVGLALAVIMNALKLQRPFKFNQTFRTLTFKSLKTLKA